jgi:putative DNA primase/helicase
MPRILKLALDEVDNDDQKPKAQPPTEQPIEPIELGPIIDKKWEARKEELLKGLYSKNDPIDYARERKIVAKELGVPAKDVDDAIKLRRQDSTIKPLYDFWTVEPWPEQVATTSLLEDIIGRLRRHVIISDEGVLAIALWLMLSWVHDEICTISPILNINSAEPESGKTTTISVLQFLMPKCITSVEVSEAALYRSIQRWSPSFCFDEFDSVLADRDKGALRSVINSGHRRGQGVLRCTGDDQILKKNQSIEKFNNEDDNGLAELRRRLLRWAQDNGNDLRNAKPAMPDKFRNRNADNWQIQFAIAELAGENWAERARAAASKIESQSDSSTASARALEAIKLALENLSVGDVASEDLIDKMAEDPDSDWAEWKNEKKITPRQLARLLERYGIVPGKVYPASRGGRQARGYKREWFVDAFETWL